MTESEPVVERPVLRVVHGAPDAAELAALVAVVTAMGGDGPGADRPRSTWAAPHRMVRRPLPTGGWRTSFAPR